jgi:hypothetical protein
MQNKKAKKTFSVVNGNSRQTVINEADQFIRGDKLIPIMGSSWNNI